jgi:exodeoxyribonuclease VII large subunit
VNSNGYIRLSELLQIVNDALQIAVGERSWWIIAEIKERTDRGEYIYFELTEKAEAGEDLVARIRASVWRREAVAAFRNFEDITGKRPEKGMQVLVKAGINFHPVHGLSLQLFDIDSQHMLGQLELQRRQTIANLAAQKGIMLRDGVFQTPNKEAELPIVIQNISVITSASAAGYQDFTDTIHNNPFGYKFNIRPYFSILQGEKAAESMREQLLKIYSDHESGIPTDVVVMVRGGGAQSDLLPFDQFRLAHALARFPIPVITGIGHLKDESVADLVVNTSVKTPTQAAEFIIDHNRSFEESIEGLRELITLRGQMMIKNASRRLDHLSVRISGGTTNLLHLRHNSLVRMQEVLRHSSIQMLNKSANRLNELQLRFRTSPLRITDRASLTLDKLEAQFRLLDPKNILKRGYALISRDQNIIRSVDQISLDETIKVTLADGTLQTVITTITKNDNE